MTIVFALTLPVLLLGTSMAMDLAGASRTKLRLQNSVDAATLAAAAEPRDDEGSRLNAATASIENNFAPEEIDELDLTIELEVDDNRTVNLIATATYDQKLLGLFGVDDYEFEVTAASPLLERPPLHIALVTDTTNSMAGPNMRAMRRAVEQLLDKLRDSDDDVKISLVPYSQYVNIGLDKEGEPWLDTSLTIHEETTRRPRRCRPEVEVIEPRRCRPTGEIVRHPILDDGIVTGYRDERIRECTPRVTRPTGETVCRDERVDTQTTRFHFTGCAGSRDAPWDLAAEASASQPIRAAMKPHNDRGRRQKVTCGQPLTPLTDDLSLVERRVASLVPNGDTYLPSGLMWGWRTLDPSVPFTEAAGAAHDTVSAVILMTDGGNVINRNTGAAPWNGYHFNRRRRGQPGLDHFSQLCNAVKTDGHQIFTVAYALDPDFVGGDTEGALRSCASSSGHAYVADNAGELADAFESALDSLSQVRLSR